MKSTVKKFLLAWLIVFVLAPAALCWRRRLLWVQLGCLLLVAALFEATRR